MSEERTLQRDTATVIADTIAKERKRHEDKRARHALNYGTQSEKQAPEHKYYCTHLERAFLNAIKKSYLRFRKEYYSTSEDFEVDDPVELYLTFSDEILEGNDLLIDDLEHVIRAWEEELL